MNDHSSDNLALSNKQEGVLPNNRLATLISDKYRNYFTFAWIFLLYLVAYGPMIFRYGYCIEEINEGIFSSIKLYFITNSRWGVGLWRSLMGIGGMPITAGLVAGAFIAAAILLQIRTFKLRGISEFIYAGVYLAAYTHWLGYIRFSTQSDCVALAMCATSLAVYMLRNNKLHKITTYIYTPLLLTFSISIYQSIVTYAATLWLGCMMHDVIKGRHAKELLNQLLAIFAVLAISVCTYALTVLTIKCISGTDSSHLNHYLGWNKLSTLLLDRDYFFLQLWNWGIIYPAKNVLGMIQSGQWIYTTALLAIALVLLNLICTARQWGASLRYALLGSMMLYVPYCLNIILLSNLPPYVYVAHPLVPAIAWGICSITWDNKSILSKCCIGFTILLIFKTSYAASQAAYRERYAYERGREEVIAMDIRSRNVAIAANYQDYEIILLGNPIFDDIYKDRVCSYFFYVRSAMERIVSPYFRLNKIRVGNEDDMQRHRHTFEQMPTWPANGSVKASDRAVIIRIGD